MHLLCDKHYWVHIELEGKCVADTTNLEQARAAVLVARRKVDHVARDYFQSVRELAAKSNDAALAFRGEYDASIDALIAAAQEDAKAEVVALKQNIEQMRNDSSKNKAYREVNELASALASLFPSWVGVDPSEPDWPVLYVQLPTGQVSWHIGKDDADLIEGIAREGSAWEGHTREDRSARLQALVEDAPCRRCGHGRLSVCHEDQCVGCDTGVLGHCEHHLFTARRALAGEGQQ